MKRNGNDAVRFTEWRIKQFAAHQLSDEFTHVLPAIILQLVNQALDALTLGKKILRRRTANPGPPPEVLLNRVTRLQVKPRPRQVITTQCADANLSGKQRSPACGTKPRIHHPPQIAGEAQQCFHPTKVRLSGSEFQPHRLD